MNNYFLGRLLIVSLIVRYPLWWPIQHEVVRKILSNVFLPFDSFLVNAHENQFVNVFFCPVMKTWNWTVVKRSNCTLLTKAPQQPIVGMTKTGRI